MLTRHNSPDRNKCIHDQNNGTMARIWPWAKADQILQIRSQGGTVRLGVEIVTGTGRETRLMVRKEQTTGDNKGVLEGVKVNIEAQTSIAAVYIGAQTPAKETALTLEEARRDKGGRTITVADLNARHPKWDKTGNVRGTTVVRWANCKGMIITPPPPSYCAKGRAGESSPDLLIDVERAEVTQTRSYRWENKSDHTPLL